MTRSLKVLRECWNVSVVALLVVIVSAPGSRAESDADDAGKKCVSAQAEWLKAGSPGMASPAGESFVAAAVHAERPDLVEKVIAGGDVMKRMLAAPRGGRRVELHELHVFEGVRAKLEDEMFASLSSPDDGWLARRITRDRIEVWTPSHGWLFDERGQVCHQARPKRGSGHGREWYGAFLPDGRWVTTDLEEMDGRLAFYSARGERLRSLTCEQLAPKPENGGADLIGWARSDGEGKGWVVNVGSEEGWATAWVSAHGPARVLKFGERWTLCYPRALGPRGDYLSVSVPDDANRSGLFFQEAGHGQWVDYPSYWVGAWRKGDKLGDRRWVVPEGGYVFGFWPQRQSFFIGAECENEHQPSGNRTRKARFFEGSNPPERHPIIDKTWLFDAAGQFQGWVRGRRIGDAADGRSLLLRMTSDSRIMTLGPDLRVREMRRFVWPNGDAADAVILWEDLGLGLFVDRERLVLAGWKK